MQSSPKNYSRLKDTLVHDGENLAGIEAFASIPPSLSSRSHLPHSQLHWFYFVLQLISKAQSCSSILDIDF